MAHTNKPIYMRHVHFSIEKSRTVNTYNTAYYLFAICTKPNSSIYFMLMRQILKRKICKSSNFSYNIKTKITNFYFKDKISCIKILFRKVTALENKHLAYTLHFAQSVLLKLFDILIVKYIYIYIINSFWILAAVSSLLHYQLLIFDVILLSCCNLKNILDFPHQKYINS